MKKTNLSKQEKKLMYEVRDEWINKFNSLPRIDEKKLRTSVDWLYKLCNLKPPNVYIVDDPLSAQFIKYTVGNTVWNTVRDTVENTVGNTVGDTVGNTVWNTVLNTVLNTVWNTVKNTVENTVGNTVGDTVRDTVENTVRNTVKNTVENTVLNTVENTVWNTVWNTVLNTVKNTVENVITEDSIRFEAFNFFCGSFSFGWVSFYDYFSRIGIINSDTFFKFRDFLNCGVFMGIFYENAIVVVKNPIKVYRDANQRLHNTNGMAIIFENGLGIHYIHGREIPAKFFGTITKEMFVNETNEDYRAAMFEILGEQAILDLLEAEVVDKQEIIHNVEYREQISQEKEILSLFKTKEKFPELDNQSIAWVKYICPSTQSNYLICCEPHHTSVIEAAKSLTDFNWESDESYEWNSRS